MRRPYTEAGMWGLMRVMSDPSCPIKPLPGLSCTAQPSLIGDLSFLKNPEPEQHNGSGSGKSSGGPGKRRSAPSVLNLSIRKRLSLRDVRRHGIRVKATVPKTARRLRIRLYRLRGHKKVRAGEYVAKLRKGGRVSVLWRSKTTRRLRAGTYLVQVDAAPKTGKYLAGGAQARVKVIARVRK
jgi:hypothetical protein